MRVCLCDICGDVASTGPHSNFHECFVAGVGFSVCKPCAEEIIQHIAAMQECDLADTTEVTPEPTVNFDEHLNTLRGQ